jgi:hypothetical protein
LAGWFYNNYLLDIALIDARYADKDHSKGIKVTVANKELMVMPFTLEVKFKDGSKQRTYFPVETWLQQKVATLTIPTRGDVQSVTVDPDNALPDVNRKNNSKTL